MDEEKRSEEQKDEQRVEHKNWVTDLYDKANISVNSLNWGILILGLVILGVAIFAK